MASTAWTTACSPDPHTRLTVSPGSSLGSPALRAACRATFIPAPACSTQPSTTSPTSSFVTPALAIASRMTTAPRSAAGTSFKAPPNEPIGVRHAPRMTTSKSLFKCAYLAGNDEHRAGCPLHAVEGGVGRNLAKHEPIRRDLDHCKLGDNQVHDPQARERQRASLEDFVAAVPGRMLHGDDDPPGARHQIHGAAHALDHLARNHPVRQVAFAIHLQGPEHGEIDVA